MNNNQSRMKWHEIRVTVPLSLLEPAYNFIWPYVHGLAVEGTDKSFMIRVFLFGPCPHKILKKLKNFLRVQARSLRVAHPTPVVGPVSLSHTNKFVIVPAPTSYIPPFGIPLFIQRGRAFGLGCHPCTIYCIQALQYVYTRDPDRIRSGKILDAGIGTGILSLAAAQLGAENITGVDVNNESIKEAQENAALNNVTNKIQILLCSVTAIEEQFDVVLANIYGSFLAQHAPHIGQLLFPRGWLIISGMSVPHDDTVISTFTNLGLVEQTRLRDEAWSAALLQKP
jgi:ribosomal protein L11 methyltransferase